jgi:HPr kinase/phosphorylase
VEAHPVAAATDRVHATAIASDGAAVLIRGASGSGKSDLALRCLTTSCPALRIAPGQLVADDQVLLTERSGTLFARAPDTLRGKLEVRGMGILSVPALDDVPVRLVADLTPSDAIERLPDEGASVTLFGVDVPHLNIAPFEQSAPIKLLLALALNAKDRD